MSRRASSRQRNKKGTQEKTDETPRPSRPPYALVQYEIDKTIGVVESEIMPKEAVPGSIVEVLEPVDMPERSDQKFSAKVLLYGYSIEFLNDCHFNTEGIPISNESNEIENQRALKRAHRLTLQCDKTSKMRESSLLRSHVANLQPLFPTVNQSAEKSKETTLSSQVTTDEQTNDMQGSSTDNEHSIGEQPSDMRESSTDNEQSLREQPFDMQGSSTAGEHSLGGRLQVGNDETNEIHTPSSAPSLSIVTDQFKTLAAWAKESKQRIALENFPPLQCFFPGPHKLPLGESEVYLAKRDVMNIRWVVPKPLDAKPKQKIPKDNPNAVFPLELVGDLLDLLVPDEVMMLLTGLTIPEILFNAIKDYINYRLRQPDKLPNKFFHDAIYEHARKKLRAAEKQQAKENRSPKKCAKKRQAEKVNDSPKHMKN